ncbi:C50 carotenoid epsilon cyclase [Corynebacterium humireducens NBRC 106098 = DSM 45392]|uniref:C50 carotenoid epsilon cyclase n=1 Tax=Corynebacterium humireducens NBRC 106098 = DSM 45392 TaxID=1223515 RepID=A0A0B5D851_9CORY|nr:lycopene cyclase domain-containing protein [Corynebacterium humireducens]AJE31974.1 C50 carotenoid epsilon cyclase [Corynebacterium humireducens NBRC 106098 = DSM 45392]
MTYALISLPFLIFAAVLAFRHRHAVPRQLAVTAIVAVILLVLTVIFDNVMIWAGLVGYGEDQRLGLDLGLVPVEDLFYPLVAALIIPAVWRGRGVRR